MLISGNIVDIIQQKIYKGEIEIEDGMIKSIKEKENVDNQFLLPGFVDSHIHIESSMMPPAEFSRFSIPQGTVACVCDPHEIANVCGVDGINFMIENANLSPMKFYFGAPSCVPATEYDRAGAVLDSGDIEALMKRDDIHFLAEMMNYVGVINDDEEVWRKIQISLKHGKPVDGHAPGLNGEDLRKYCSSGISTDHECMTMDEAIEKIQLGMKVLIREGSAAKNFEDLIPLIAVYPDMIMFCSDDKHPDDLIRNGHINTLVTRSLQLGYSIFDILKAATLNPVKHYRLDVGLLQQGDPADFIVVKDLNDFSCPETWIGGEKVASKGKALFEKSLLKENINQFNALEINSDDIRVIPQGNKLRVISIEEGQLSTDNNIADPLIENGNIISDIQQDVLKIVVYNRYEKSKPAIGFIRNIGIKRGAFASTVSHDSHNIVAVGTTDEMLVKAINAIVEKEGGIVAVDVNETYLLPLPIAGLMSDLPGLEVAEKYQLAEQAVRSYGSTMAAPFMTLAFMSLIVIPRLKINDKGLFDGDSYQFIPVSFGE
jgi:adenine deaminase